MPERSYMWNVAGFVTFIFLTAHFTSSADLFKTMAARVLDAIVGILIYTLIMVFIWSDSNLATLKKTWINLTAIQTKIFTLLASQNDSLEDKNSIRQVIRGLVLLLSPMLQRQNRLTGNIGKKRFLHE